MPAVILGKLTDPDRLGDLSLDVATLIDSRCLIQGNSGAGKSRLLRLLAEKVAGRTPTIIIDPEGEFSTLREKLDMVLVGRGGEIPADPRSAGLLARRLVELRVSAVLDIYELKLGQRRAFVREFLDSLLNLPKELWKKPILLAIDEAHLYCPEKSSGEAESTESVIALMSQGRKRGLGGILLTQRLSKLHKDAAAETNTVLIGRTWLDTDQKRAGDLLGMTNRDRAVLRDLQPGEFFAFGRALSESGVVRFKAGDVETTHPKVGERHRLEPPAPSAAIRSVLEQLKDLPEQAVEEVKSLEAAKARIRDLEQKYRKLERERQSPPPAPAPKRVEVSVLRAGDSRRLAKAVEGMNRLAEKLNAGLTKIETVGRGAVLDLAAMANKIEEAADGLEEKLTAPAVTVPPSAATEARPISARETAAAIDKVATDLRDRLEEDVSNLMYRDATLPGTGTERILAVVSELEARSIPVTQITVARWLGLHPSGGRFLNSVRELRKQGLLEDGWRRTIPVPRLYPPGPGGVFAALAQRKGDSGRGSERILENILKGGKAATIVELAGRLGVHPSGGRFLDSLRWLRAMAVIPAKGEIRAVDGVFR